MPEQLDLNGKRVLVLGFGVSGRAAVDLLLKKDAHVSVWDDDLNEELADKIMDTGAWVFANPYLTQEDVDLVVLSPGIHPRHPLSKL